MNQIKMLCKWDKETGEIRTKAHSLPQADIN